MHFLGAIINNKLLGRNPSRNEFVSAFLSEEILSFLAHSVNTCIASEVDREKLKNDRRYTAVASDEIVLWIAQRLEISIDVKLSINDAYNSVSVVSSDSIYLMH